MTLEFHAITIERQHEYRELLARCPAKSSDYSFTNLWGWAKEHSMDWAWAGDLVWLRQNMPTRSLWAPVGDWRGIDWQEYLQPHALAGTVFERIPDPLVEAWRESLGHCIEVKESREHWDYLYEVDELINLKGNRFHKKKNLVNQFRNKYDFRYVPLNAGTVDIALGMQENWCTWRDCESFETLASENRVISRVLSNWENLAGLMGGAIMVDRKIAAYTIGQALTPDTLVIHFEKGDSSFKGAYQAINQMFLDHAGKDFKTVNREQDLGDEGLRKAKLSYNPTAFEKKYRVIFT